MFTCCLDFWILNDPKILLNNDKFFGDEEETGEWEPLNNLIYFFTKSYNVFIFSILIGLRIAEQGIFTAKLQHSL